jgi:transposase
MRTQKLTYQDRDVYVGLDVHKKSFSVAAWFEGELIKKATLPADGKKLSQSLKKWFVEARLHTVYEAGFSGFGLHRILTQEGIDNIVVNPASVEVAANDKKKTDRRDAKKLAEQRAAGRLKGIYIPTIEEELRRQITRTREQLLRERNRIAHMIKGKLHYFGYIAPEDDRIMGEPFIAWIDQLKLPKELKWALDLLIEEWRLFSRQIEDAKIEMQIQTFEDPQSEEIYRSVPGVGLISARILVNELGNIAKRFKNQDAIYQYTGLTPEEHSSGPNIHKGNIDRQGSSRIRHLLTEIAWRSLKLDHALKECFDRIAFRRGKKRAIVAIARKIDR